MHKFISLDGTVTEHEVFDPLDLGILPDRIKLSRESGWFDRQKDDLGRDVYAEAEA